jgi:hypothetical protein
MATRTLGSPIADQSIRNPNFFNGRLLTGGDLTREQQARAESDAQLGRAHGPGIAGGLEVARVDGSEPGLVRVSRGLAVSATGRVLMLGTDPVVRLVQTAGTTAVVGGDGDFGACGALPGAPYVAGDGLFLLTLAPASFAEGSVPVLALDPVNARCSTDSRVDAVKLRLLRVDDLSIASTDATAVANLRSRAAWLHLRGAAWQAARRNPGTAPLPGPAVAGLTDCDVPLALVYMVGQVVVFVDMWAVRRRLAPSAASAPWSAWIGGENDALSEARLLQFEGQLADMPSLANAPAAAALAWLPPVGRLPAGTDWRRFLGARQPAREVPLAPGDARGVLAEALQGDPVELAAADGARFRVYRLEGGGPLLFVRDLRRVRHAEQVWFDGVRAALPAADDVQQAIEQLRAGSCRHRVLWPGRPPESALEGLSKGEDLVLCFEPGEYRWEKPFVIANLGRVHLRGPGAALTNLAGECALRIEHCAAADVADLALAGLRPGIGKDRSGLGLLGALTVVDTPRIRIERVQARCAGAEGLRAAAVVCGLRSEAAGKLEAPDLQVIDCEFTVGLDQQGLLVLNPGVARVLRNRVQGQGKGALQRGIVVGGSLAGRVLIESNVVRDAVCGIGIGISDTAKEGAPALSAGRVHLERNEVALRLSGSESGLRFGLFVGNAESVLVLGNHVQLPGDAGAKLDVHGLRLHGRYGAQVIVRDNLFEGFLRAVAFQPVGEPGRIARLWRVEDNAARGDEKGFFVEVTDFNDELEGRDNHRLPRVAERDA